MLKLVQVGSINCSPKNANILRNLLPEAQQWRSAGTSPSLGRCQNKLNGLKNPLKESKGNHRPELQAQWQETMQKGPLIFTGLNSQNPDLIMRGSVGQ